MTPEQAYQIYQELCEQESRCIETRHLDGRADSQMGHSPQALDEDYLNGYIEGIKDLVLQGEHLEIRWLSRAYRSNGFDSPDVVSLNPF